MISQLVLGIYGELDFFISDLSPGLVKYTTGKFTVYFNANDDAKDINESGKQIVINETNGTYSTAANGKIAKVAGKGFVIIEK